MLDNILWLSNAELTLERAGGLASVIALLFAIYSFIRVMRCRKLLEHDREYQGTENLPEALVNLRWIAEHLSDLTPTEHSDRKGRYEAFRRLGHLENFFEQYFGSLYGISVSGGDVIVNIARHYKRSGQVNKAIVHYDKAIHLSRNVSFRDYNECYRELQSCYLTIWCVDDAQRIAREASDRGIETCVHEQTIKNFYWYLCTVAAFKLMVVDAFSILTRRKGRLKTLTSVR